MTDFDNSSFICKGDKLYTNDISAIGTAVGLSGIGKKTGVATDGSRAAKSAAYSIMGALSSASSRVWDFGESFYAQFQYLVKFCSLDSGIFISRKNAQTVIRICGKNGLPISINAQNEIESIMNNSKFLEDKPAFCGEISEMHGVGMMYLRQLLRQARGELKNISCFVKCRNDKISSLMEDCLYRLECRQGDEMTLKINNDGKSLSVFHRDCGWLSFDRISAILVKYETQSGNDIAVPFNSPFALSEIAENEGAKVYRYSLFDTEMPADIQRVVDNCTFLTDGLFAAIKLLWAICDAGKSVAKLSSELPDFYVSRKITDSPFDASNFSRECKKNGIIIKNGVAILDYPKGRATVTPSRTGNKIHIMSEAANYEISKEICDITMERFINQSIDTNGK